MNALIENGIANRPKAHFQLLHFNFWPTVADFCHHLLAVNGPAFDKGSALENRTHQCRRAEFVGVGQLQVMAGHRFVHGEIADHIVIVFSKKRFFALL